MKVLCPYQLFILPEKLPYITFRSNHLQREAFFILAYVCKCPRV